MQALLYFLVAIASTTAGAITGMGGGVVIKPVLDLLGQFDAATIGVLSSVTVLFMSMVSVGRQLAHTKIPFGTAIPLAVGSVVGGNAGQRLLTLLIARLDANGMVMAAQNICLALLIVGVYLYMRNKSRLRSLCLKGVVWPVLVGLLLGVLSSFLGIGGGPINVALLIFAFSFDTKTAAICSLVTILFAQLSKLGMILVTTGFAQYNLSMLLPMVIGGVAGGLIGAKLSRRFSEKTVERWFNGMQILVFCICVVNVARSLLSI